MRHAPDERDSLALWLGRLVLAWGDLEAAISVAVLMLYYEWGGHPSERKGPPRSLERKLTFIENCCNDNEQLAPHRLIRDGGLGIVHVCRHLADLRHKLNHGAIWGEPDDLLVMMWDRIRKDGGGAVVFTSEAEITELVEHVHDVIPVAFELVRKLREVSPNPLH